MANPYGYGQGPPPGSYAAGYGAPPMGQPGYAHPGPPAYGAPPPPGGQVTYGAPPPQATAYGAPGAAYGQQPGNWAPPGTDPQIYQWFTSVDTDRSGRINTMELQQALVNGNWSHFNQETCRLMISMFDRDQSATIDFMEFQGLWKYLQDWRGVFEHFDRDRSGAIESQELHSAFQQLGYNVSANFVNLVVCKFDFHARRRLTLDSFIQSCVLMRLLTDAFKQRDTTMSGTVKMSYEDFLTLAVSYKI